MNLPKGVLEIEKIYVNGEEKEKGWRTIYPLVLCTQRIMQRGQ